MQEATQNHPHDLSSLLSACTKCELGSIKLTEVGETPQLWKRILISRLEVRDSRIDIIHWNCNSSAGFPRRGMLVAPRRIWLATQCHFRMDGRVCSSWAHSIASFVRIAFLPATGHYSGETGICCVRVLIASDTCQSQGKAGRIHSVFPITFYLGNRSRRFYTISWKNDLKTT